ncbi:nucleoside hydrolase, partial [Salmonella enterica subsp. enterica serovar Lubbock]|nr:nucleoside hydrolase [Salmonella enterica subsp. enterica serovar Lubbock]
KGDLRRDERNLMWNVDPYLQTQWQLTQKLSLDAGVRYSSVWFQPVTIVSTGPQTNVALLLNSHPELHTKIARIVIMGGAMTLGN